MADIRSRARGCVLCATCANSLRRSYERERRGLPRTCSAGQAPVGPAFECESYVRGQTPRPHIDVPLRRARRR